jgi:hypothetical protein
MCNIVNQAFFLCPQVVTIMAGSESNTDESLLLPELV